jgi:hypothetical protein
MPALMKLTRGWLVTRGLGARVHVKFEPYAPAVGWAKARSLRAVPTGLVVVGTLRFAHPTGLIGFTESIHEDGLPGHARQ